MTDNNEAKLIQSAPDEAAISIEKPAADGPKRFRSKRGCRDAAPCFRLAPRRF